jgi:hypothetical protein
MTSHDCGEGLTWDAELQLCGWANTIECKNGEYFIFHISTFITINFTFSCYLGNRPWEKITDMNGSNYTVYNIYVLNSLLFTIVFFLKLVTLFPTRIPRRSTRKKKTTFKPQPVSVETNYTCAW